MRSRCWFDSQFSQVFDSFLCLYCFSLSSLFSLSFLSFLSFPSFLSFLVYLSFLVHLLASASPMFQIYLYLEAASPFWEASLFWEAYPLSEVFLLWKAFLIFVASPLFQVSLVSFFSPPWTSPFYRLFLSWQEVGSPYRKRTSRARILQQLERVYLIFYLNKKKNFFLKK